VEDGRALAIFRTRGHVSFPRVMEQGRSVRRTSDDGFGRLCIRCAELCARAGAGAVILRQGVATVATRTSEHSAPVRHAGTSDDAVRGASVAWH
jgi:hypothetical protein